ncbi:MULTISPECIES: LysR family transcriptional regulator [unclassified Beijerinckia]|uniref:LysR family transcriptional regulator n=1 Tax=unclassified Beijerinckia TaxID=2638183 RepID=UPI0008979EBD|nr:MULTISPECIES: LysR family transcriptional regulator [unclassified Beijerinckia]MDH7795062.1 DNA-binding transcriptional LysR family regulator [Beijerinckia sp. GAS462]SEB86014.1 transcriptional regulator, LysR family [Beijerinckia sp. 28-YEA-48]
MDIYLNFKAFQVAARRGSFSAAARELGLAASVVTKRVTQLEHHLKTVLFERSTRSLSLTEAGRRYLERSRLAIAGFEDLLRDTGSSSEDVEDFLRVKFPTSLTIFQLRKIVSRYRADFPRVRLEIVLMDRPVDPVAEGFDLAVGAYWTTFGGVVETHLLTVDRVLCAAASYIAGNAPLRHPRELAAHACLNYLPTGNAWTFKTKQGLVTVEVTPTLSSNDAQILIDAAVAGTGIVLLSEYMVRDLLASGTLIQLLPEFSIPPFQITAVAPIRRGDAPAVRALIERLRQSLALTFEHSDPDIETARLD